MHRQLVQVKCTSSKKKKKKKKKNGGLGWGEARKGKARQGGATLPETPALLGQCSKNYVCC
jgi:hypothetical protein